MKNNDRQRRLEHETVRRNVGYYDFTHELLEVTGPDAGKFLDKIFVASINDAKVGEAKYTTMLDEEGIIHDDVIVFRVEENTYWISTLYIDDLIKWLDEHKEGYDVSYEDRTARTTMYAVQGPKSRDVLNDILRENIDDMKYFNIEDNQIGNTRVKIARSGYTGELGYEIYCNPDDTEMVESILEEAGEPYGIENIETDVIVTSLPREKGFVLMSDLEGTNPLEVGFGWTIDWDKDFIGKDALEKVKEEGPERELLGFTVDDENAEIEAGAKIEKDGEKVGKVTMFTYGFTVGENIGFALVELDKAKKGDKVTIKDNGNEYEVELVDRVFYDPENKKVRG